ncbi:ketosamine-3-kinase [Parasteatoda tepidariorum]|uniref:protein-ribulosamine 3-kinase n=1 Tax=Parasteatoda tepidariorum TaxID=114398 RepID=A0A2L2YJR8_PARTP|nr:ketosamine-3-kinase [Parasteatoda tepidariorum]XP_042901158.1 ketosamine-3-kinase [Parasteatoda tepidariorum]
MENELKAALKLSSVKFRGSATGGCIHEGKIYVTENGPIFVKISKDPMARPLFEGEIAGLRAIHNTKTVRVPTPIEIVELSKGLCLVMEYVDMRSLTKAAIELGDELAKMHLHNRSLKSNEASIHKNTNDGVQYIDQYGFHCPTYCGRIIQDNTWKENWAEFFAQKIDSQLKLIESDYADREARELWSELSLKVPNFFKDVEVTPSLLHGDLWSGNAASAPEGAIIFDPASFYGHDEYDLAIAKMFGGFSQAFFTAYHNVLPKKPNFEKRIELYQLFHYLNHWNHFGTGYRSSSISIMRSLLQNL